ncbi:AAA family ATPase [Pseudoalteromonas sp. SR41-7]|uniref:AAA family ATPase n=1 Tax=Pseudoalteromonas sp. SR41-7 TaxID=2760947 RepID=UPI00160350F8|nr:AAA family ATPase [Pseudoalteromonas sp. SR41-7]MBB1297500.1 AAA family ATPase [Pseudoalteromonas sp. SR41-7]
MRLHELHINNFRKLKNCCIKFRDTTFLIGPNNAGKSGVFAALNHLHKNSNLDREDYSKEYNEEEESYSYESEVEVIAEYHNVPIEANSWLGFKGRIITVVGYGQWCTCKMNSGILRIKN